MDHGEREEPEHDARDAGERLEDRFEGPAATRPRVLRQVHGGPQPQRVGDQHRDHRDTMTVPTTIVSRSNRRRGNQLGPQPPRVTRSASGSPRPSSASTIATLMTRERTAAAASTRRTSRSFRRRRRLPRRSSRILGARRRRSPWSETYPFVGARGAGRASPPGPGPAVSTLGSLPPPRPPGSLDPVCRELDVTRRCDGVVRPASVRYRSTNACDGRVARPSPCSRR